ncbi:MAG: hypothetical protein KKA19_08235, partial [Candidatus Margulisbacteria bacterium]|nr:hypothetical protein [Candidatus Margulisiibacteriota bacterium]
MTEVKTLTHEKLEAEHEKITKAYKAIIFEEKKRIQYKNLGAYLKEKKLDNPTQEHKRIAILLNEIIVRQLREYAMLQFLIMEKANEFGAMGEQRVSISFCRNILQIPANREVNQDDADIFRQKIDEFEKDIQVTSVAKLKEMEKSFKLKLLGEQIEILQSSLLDQVFSFIGIPYRLATATFKGEQTFIYGQIEEKIIAGKQVNISGKEIVRSPLYVLSIAAGQGANKGIIIRKESCETIFYNKWVSFFEMNQTERVIYNTHAHSAIREGLKEKALNYYEVSSKNELLKIKDLFIQEMIEGIFYHEVGHEVGERPEVLAEHLAVLGRSRGVMGDDIILVLKEAVADWAPQVGKQSGPIWAFLKKAKKDKNIAQRLLYVYLSDNWFIDSDEEFMGIQTDVLTAFLLSYINKNGSFDFATLEKDFSGIVSFILNKYKSILEKMKVILDEGIYMAGIHRINFQTLEKELHKVYQKEF